MGCFFPPFNSSPLSIWLHWALLYVSSSSLQVVKQQVEDLLLELLQENAHIHPALGVKDADLKTNETNLYITSHYCAAVLVKHTMKCSHPSFLLTTPGCCWCFSYLHHHPPSTTTTSSNPMGHWNSTGPHVVHASLINKGLYILLVTGEGTVRTFLKRLPHKT